MSRRLDAVRMDAICLRATRARLLIALCLLCSGFAALGGQVVPDSRGALTNPALLGVSRRSFFEIGLQTDLAAYNNAFPLGHIFQQTWTIDLDDVAARLRGRDLRAGAAASARGHVVVHLRGVCAGVYLAAISANEMVVPYGFVELLAEGNVADRSGRGDAVLRSGYEYGASVSADYRRWTFGVNLAQHVPVMHSGEGGFSFEVITTDSGLSADAVLDVAVFSAIDLGAGDNGGGLDFEAGLSNAALKADLGVVRRDHADRPIWGASLTNLTIVRARTPYEYRLTGTYSASVEEAIQTLIDDPDADPLTLAGDEPRLTFIGASDERMALAPGISGFYRFELPWVDIIPHGELVFDRKLGAVNPGVTIAGNRFPLNLIYLSFARRRPVWRASLGLSVPLRVAELSVRLEGASPRMIGAFAPDGLSAAMQMRFGY